MPNLHPGAELRPSCTRLLVRGAVKVSLLFNNSFQHQLTPLKSDRPGPPCLANVPRSTSRRLLAGRRTCFLAKLWADRALPRFLQSSSHSASCVRGTLERLSQNDGLAGSDGKVFAFAADATFCLMIVRDRVVRARGREHFVPPDQKERRREE